MGRREDVRYLLLPARNDILRRVQFRLKGLVWSKVEKEEWTDQMESKLQRTKGGDEDQEEEVKGNIANALSNAGRSSHLENGCRDHELKGHSLMWRAARMFVFVYKDSSSSSNR